MSKKDPLNREQRSKCMAAVKSKDTSIEVLFRSHLHLLGFRFRKNVSNLPGRPDIVFRNYKVVVFIDGDFWHGYRFSTWGKKLPQYWQIKISKNRSRDIRNFAYLRRNGWKVVRIWEHEINEDLFACLEKVANCF